MNTISDKTLRNFAGLRKAYGEMPKIVEDEATLLENAMLEIQEVLEENNIDWTEFNSDELLEE